MLICLIIVVDSYSVFLFLYLCDTCDTFFQDYLVNQKFNRTAFI